MRRCTATKAETAWRARTPERACGPSQNICRGWPVRSIGNSRGYLIASSAGSVEIDPTGHDSIDNLLAEADAAMYRDKYANDVAGS